MPQGGNKAQNGKMKEGPQAYRRILSCAACPCVGALPMHQYVNIAQIWTADDKLTEFESTTSARKNAPHCSRHATYTKPNDILDRLSDRA